MAGKIDVDISRDGENVLSNYHWGVLVGQSTMPQLSSRYLRERPANVHNPRSYGWRYPSPFHHRAFYFRYGELGLAYNGYPFYEYTWTNFSPATPFSLSLLTEPLVYPQYVEDRCINKALNKLYDGQAGLGEDYAQWQQSCDMVADLKSDIASSATSFRRSNPKVWFEAKRAVKFGKGLPRRWLAWQYGWKPALQDIHDVMRHVADRLNNNSGRRHVVANTKEVVNRSSTGDYSLLNGQRVTGVTTRRDEYRARTRFDFSIGDADLVALNQLGMLNPAQLAWNLLPFSFLVDWFLPVDDFLSALAAPWGYRFIAGSTTISGLSAASWSPTGTSDPLRYTLLQANRSTVNMYEMSRTVHHTFPGPRVPAFKNPLSLTHLANATSLLVSAFQKG